ncbi:MAG: DUF1294 domain-containing protein [Bacillota bacterium]|nr:DUF1294 domain-containing protein [Bacillota bacterium]MDP4169635.1 DUF1294 domain-containing protein [Bacillota bacterium]
MNLLIFYLLINAVGFLMMGEDKKRARKHQYRIQERTLWLVAIFGGAVGSTIGMQVFRHKTKHTSFKIGFPLLAAVEFVLFVYFSVK